MKTREQALQDVADYLDEVGEALDVMTPEQIAERIANDRAHSTGSVAA